MKNLLITLLLITSLFELCASIHDNYDMRSEETEPHSENYSLQEHASSRQQRNNEKNNHEAKRDFNTYEQEND